MSEKRAAEHADSEQRDKQDAMSSSSDSTASGADREGHLPAGGEIAATTAELSSSVTAEPEQRSSQHVGSGASDMSADSLVRKSGPSSSSPIQSEAAAVAAEQSAPLSEHKSEACQTPETANVEYRSLNLQFSPVRRHQEHRSSKPFLTLSPVWTENDWPDGQHSPLSLKAPRIWSQRPENLSMQWNSVTPPDVDTASTSTTQSFTRASQPGKQSLSRKTVLQQATEDLEIESTPPAGLNVSVVPQSRAQQRDAHDKAPHELEAPGSPLLLAPWRETPQNLDRKRGTPEVFRDTSSSASGSASASELSSPLIGSALHSPKLRSVASDTTPRIPWVTLAVIWLQLQSHWKYLHKDYPDRCASVSTILHENRWERVLFATFHHGDVQNLALNSLSLFAKGVLLEAGLGTAHFAALFFTAAVLVGLVNTFILFCLYEYTKLSSFQTVCSQTFVGVIMTLEALASTKFGKVRIHYGKRRFRFRRKLFAVLETVLLLSCTESNVCPIVSGILVGAFLAHTSLGNFITRIRRPRRSIYLCVLPYAPVTFLFVAAIIVAFLLGPFPDTVALAETGLSFSVPVWRPMLLPTLYQPDVYWLAYAVLSIWDVGEELEKDLGHLSFLFLAVLLVNALNVLLDGLCSSLWCHLLALGANLPTPVPHSSSCTCALVAALMALKVIHHVTHPGCVYRMASVPVYVPFWSGVLLELTVQNLASASAAYVFGPIVGILLGIAVAYAWIECLSKLTVRLAGLSDIGILLRGTYLSPANLLLMLRR
ncbi:uncharacterized protein [Dermacentor andersoni]|uniref:uncharacterized protein isoform X2 n=1 Tax=Dermacentor andersoni TaxID=34620 RepID=UPI003B3BA280